MAKKNKFKRNKSDIPSNIFDGGGNITNMYTLNISGPKLSQSGLPSSYLTGLKYSNMSNISNSSSGKGLIGNSSLAPVYGAAAGMGFDTVDTLLAGGKKTGLGTGAVNAGATLMTSGLSSGNPSLILAGGIAGTAGTIFNAAFGSKMNEERIALAENEINAANSFNANASDFNALSLLIANSPVIAGFNLKDIGSDGLFSNKAKNKYKSLLALKEFAENWVDRSITNAATNLLQQLTDNLLLNYAAYGGLLDYGSSSAIDYDLANKQLGIESMKAMGLNRQYSLPNLGLNTFAEGGGIHIKPSKRGTFTAAAKKHGKGVLEFASLVLANKENYSPAMIKKAVFAKNFGGRKKAFGGDLLTNGTVFSNNVIEVNNGSTHEENPMEGVLMGVDSLGIPNLVEEGELIWNNYVFSNRIKVPDSVKDKYKLRGTKDMTFSDAAKKILKASEERPNDPIANDTLNINLTRLANEQEVMRELRNMKKNNKFKHGGSKNTISLDAWNLLSDVPSSIDIYDTTNLAPENKIPSLHFYNLTRQNLSNLNKLHNEIESIDDILNRDNLLRYAPAFGSALGVGYGLLSKPNYSRADALALFAQNAGKITPISYDPLGNYLTYRPVDTNYIANRMAALAGATRRNIMNTSGGNRANAVGSLLAADYNSLIALADAIRQGEDTNWNRLMQTETFNRGTNLYNSEAALKAAMANQEAAMKASQLGLSGYTTAMKMKDDIDALRNASISANFTNLFDSLGDIGREEVIKKMVKDNPALLYDYFGKYKGSKAKGGKINRKKRGGFTY